MRKNTHRISRFLAASMASIIMMTTAGSVITMAAPQQDICVSLHAANNGIVTGTYGDYKTEYHYTDTFFAGDPVKYDEHLATMSMNMADASDTYVVNGDYSDGAHGIHKLLGELGFSDLYANDGYLNKPTADSIGCAIGTKTVNIGTKTKKIISITIRSSSYEREWASNVTLGKNGEAKGFADAADKVIKSFKKEYLKAHPELEQDLKNGEVAFWLQGFSRGGAVANLTAKRLIDEYQADGNKVFAYCLEAPQGGTSSPVRKDRDYRSIHNVINRDDLVPYVAPTGMGFMRYGVDHYLNDETANENNLRSNIQFPNNKADNDISKKVSAERIKMVENEIVEMVGKSDLNDIKPYNAVGKTLNINFSKASVSLDDVDVPTYVMIRNIVNALGKGVKRNDYASSGVEDSLRRITQFVFTGLDMDSMKDALDYEAIVKSIIVQLIKEYSPENVVVQVAGAVKNFMGDLFSGKGIKKMSQYVPSFGLTDLRGTLAGGIGRYISTNRTMSQKFANYEGGAAKAGEDVALLVKTVLKCDQLSISDLVVFGINAQGILHNHSMVQTLAWLRSYDSWYAEGALEMAA